MPFSMEVKEKGLGKDDTSDYLPVALIPALMGEGSRESWTWNRHGKPFIKCHIGISFVEQNSYE